MNSKVNDFLDWEGRGALSGEIEKYKSEKWLLNEVQ